MWCEIGEGGAHTEEGDEEYTQHHDYLCLELRVFIVVHGYDSNERK